MRVRINDIAADGLKINDTIPLAALNARMAEGSDSGINFTKAPRVDIRVCKTAQGATVSGTVESKYQQECSMCLRSIDREVKADIELTLKPRSGENDHRLNDLDDIGIAFFDGEHIELEELIQEALILTLSPFWHPVVEADGNCVECGVSPPCEQGVKSGQQRTFNELFKRAGVIQ